MSDTKYLDYEGLQEVAGNVNTRLKTVTSLPATASNGAVRLYVGETSGSYTQGHIYKNTAVSSSVSAIWEDITPTSGGGSSDYLALSNKPSINGKVLVPNSDGHTYRLVNADDLGGFTETCEQNTSLPTTYTVISFIEFNGKLYAGTSSRGIFVSTDGITFTLITSLPTSLQISAFIEFNGKLYAGGDAIFVSEDVNTFVQNTSFPTTYPVTSFIEYNGKLYVGTVDAGIYTSTDGDTFMRSTSFPTTYSVYAFIEFNRNLYVGTQNHGIYVSEDGNTFVQNTSFPTTYTVISFIEYNGKLYAGTPNHGIYTSTDGDTFTQNTSFPTNYTVRAFIEFNGKLYAGTTGHGIYVSTDGDIFTQNVLFPTDYTSAALTEFNGKLYAGTNNYGIYIIALVLLPTSTPYVQELDKRYQKGQLGDLSSLNTTSKTTIVSAVNEVNNKVDSLPSPVTPKGTIPFASLPSLASVEVGWMYNISDDFTTTSDFVISGISEKAGSNVYCIDAGSGVKKWDVFATGGGTVDQTYSPTSANAQSGTAVAEAIEKKPNTFVGTRAEWEELTTAEKQEYDICNLTDDLAGGELLVSDEVTAGDLNPVTSNAVASYIPNITRELVSWPTESSPINWGSHKGVIIQTGNEVGTIVTNQVLVMRNFPNTYVGQLFYLAQSNSILTAAVTKTSEGFYLVPQPADWVNNTVILYWID